MNPKARVKGAWVLFFVTVILGVYCTIWVAKTSYERVLIAISWGAITITCVDIILTTDVRAKK